MCEFSWFTTIFLRALERKLRLDAGRYLFMLSLMRVGFFNRGEIRAHLKCEGKESSVSDKLTIDVISFIRMSIQSFT